MSRKLKAEWTVEPICQAKRNFATDGTFDYIPEVMWYQFKRYKLLFNPTENYLKSRLYFLKQCKILTEALKEEMAKELPYKWEFPVNHPTILRHRLSYYFKIAEKVVRTLGIVVAITYAILLVISLYY